MSALPDLTDIYEVTASGESLDRGAWITMNPRVLLGPPEKRGSNLTVPRADGTMAMAHKLDEVTGTLRMLFIGDVDRTGAAAANPSQQLLENLFWFEANVYNAATVNNTVAITVAGPGSFSKSGYIQWTGFEWGDEDHAGGLTTCRAVLRFTIPQRLA